MKGKIKYTLEYKIDETNRCVVCWLTPDEEFMQDYVIEKTRAVFEFLDPYIYHRSMPIKVIKTVARAYEGDHWDPEGLKVLARKKAVRKMNQRMNKFFLRLSSALIHCAHDTMLSQKHFENQYIKLDNEIQSSEFYEKWRESEKG